MESRAKLKWIHKSNWAYDNNSLYFEHSSTKKICKVWFDIDEILYYNTKWQKSQFIHIKNMYFFVFVLQKKRRKMLRNEHKNALN